MAFLLVLRALIHKWIFDRSNYLHCIEVRLYLAAATVNVFLPWCFLLWSNMSPLPLIADVGVLSHPASFSFLGLKYRRLWHKGAIAWRVSQLCHTKGINAFSTKREAGLLSLLVLSPGLWLSAFVSIATKASSKKMPLYLGTIGDLIERWIHRPTIQSSC